jgi:uncharacterized membrane protein (DUF2068 family)
VAEPSIERAQEAEPPSQRDGGSAHEVWTEVEAKPRRKWHRETFACAFSGHVVPAAHVAKLRPEDAGLGFDLPDGRRFARCLRCDAWVQTTPPEHPQAEHLPPIDRLDIPKRGKQLRDLLVLRLIAIDRAFHSLLFGLLAVVAILAEANLGSLDRVVRDLVARLSDAGPANSQSFVIREMQRFLHLQKHTLVILAVTAVAYCVVEGVEAVGLWLEKRWAEYLTVIATAGFLPFEIHELIKRITWVRIAALVVNVAILVWLVWRKRLFGIRGGVRALEAETVVDRETLFAPPSSDRTGLRQAADR